MKVCSLAWLVVVAAEDIMIAGYNVVGVPGSVESIGVGVGAVLGTIVEPESENGEEGGCGCYVCVTGKNQAGIRHAVGGWVA